VPDVVEIYTGEMSPIIRVRSMESVSAHRVLYGSGTGFVLQHKDRKFIVTAHHVVSSGVAYDFLTMDKKPLKVKIVNIIEMPLLDITMFEINEISGKCIPLHLGRYIQGGRVTAMGFPQDGDYSERSGVNIRSRIESTVDVDLGMSGGPVLDLNGDVIGVISEKVLSAGKLKSVFSKLDEAVYRLDNK